MVRTIPLLTEEFESLPESPTAAQKQQLGQSIGSAGRATLQALRIHGLNLSPVLSTNIKKIQSMFGPDEPGPAKCFDSGDAPRYERLPRKLHIQFLERKSKGGRVEVITRVNDINIGDRLTDNAAIDDGYRYHDAF